MQHEMQQKYYLKIVRYDYLKAHCKMCFLIYKSLSTQFCQLIGVGDDYELDLAVKRFFGIYCRGDGVV